MSKSLLLPAPLKGEHTEVKFHMLHPQQFALSQALLYDVRDVKASQNSFVTHRKKRLHVTPIFLFLFLTRKSK